jgi:prolyl 4-hydroxylase
MNYLLFIYTCLVARASIAYSQHLDGNNEAGPPQHCADWSGAECSWEPNLQKMTADFGPDLKETFYAYVQSDVSLFYNETAGTRVKVPPKHIGQYGKFTNLSPDEIHLYWLDIATRDKTFMAIIEPFGSSGTSTYPTHHFVAVKTSRPMETEVMRWEVMPGISNYYYDPYGGSDNAAKLLSAKNLGLYQMQLMNRLFAEQYKAFTGTDWLALYKQKMPPRFHMWRADAFGQTHAVETKQIHFVDLPAQEELERGMSVYGPRPDQVNRMRRYRDKHYNMNLTLTVLSCAPRVFEIQNFLSHVEVQHILDLASKQNLDRSTVGDNAASTTTSTTRTSKNTWVPRRTDFITDTIYKRAADVLQINEALLRSRRASEIPELTESHVSVAERLQLVHYEVGQNYAPHHDFSMPPLVNLQPSRFATLLFYLNDDVTGGETAFPLWVNAETNEALNVKAAFLFVHSFHQYVLS